MSNTSTDSSDRTSCNNHLTETDDMNFIFDEDEIISGIGYSSRYRTQAMSSSTQTRFDRAPSEAYYGMYLSDPRPTKAEAKAQLEFLTIPFRVGAPFVPPVIKPIFVGAPRLAELLIEIDPQDRFRD